MTTYYTSRSVVMTNLKGMCVTAAVYFGLVLCLISCDSTNLFVNQPPTVQILEGNRIANYGESITLEAEVTDPDGDSVTLSWFVDGEPQLSEPQSTIVLKFEPDVKTSYLVALLGTDDGGLSSKDSIIVTVSASDTTVFGKVLDQSGTGINGLVLSYSTVSATSDVDGMFTFQNAPSGEFILRGIGGTDRHYAIPEQSINVISGAANDIGEIVAIETSAVGIVAQSVSDDTARASALSRPAALKRNVDIAIAAKSSLDVHERAGVKVAGSQSFLLNNVSFFKIFWEPVADAAVEYYEVYFQDPSGLLSVPVWHSGEQHEEDPSFDPAEPAAYLDIGNELHDLVVEPGLYQFQIVGFGPANEELVRLSPIIASIATIINTFVQDAVFSDSAATWSGLPGAGSYTFHIFGADGSQIGVPIEGLGTASVTASFPEGLSAGEYYQVYIDAFAFNSDGFVAEVSRSVGGFVR